MTCLYARELWAELTRHGPQQNWAAKTWIGFCRGHLRLSQRGNSVRIMWCFVHYVLVFILDHIIIVFSYAHFYHHGRVRFSNIQYKLSISTPFFSTQRKTRIKYFSSIYTTEKETPKTGKNWWCTLYDSSCYSSNFLVVRFQEPKS